MTDKPYYVIDFSATNCFIDIRVNDVCVFCLNVEGQVGTNIRVNYAILKEGTQRVSYTVLPIAGEISLRENVDFSATLSLYDASGYRIEKIEELNTYKIPENANNSLVPLYKHEAVFHANVPYRIQAWENSADLRDIDGLRELVDKAYKKIEYIFSSGNYAQFIDMIVARENDIATSMYMYDYQKEERVKEFLEILQEGYNKVIPTSPLDIMVVHAYGKLVTLKKPNGRSAFLLKNSAGEELFLELKFHLPQGSSELVVI